jgi:hypothetical protein
VFPRVDYISTVFNYSGTDKYHHGYAAVYATVPVDIHNMLEIGVLEGNSLAAWEDIFPEATIYGLDAGLKDRRFGPRVHQLVSDVKAFDVSPLPDLDLVVDDGSHRLEDILGGWERIHHKVHGMYIIEDVLPEYFMPVWQTLVSTYPKSEIILWRTNDLHWGHSTSPVGDSHCFVVRIP